MGEVYQAQQLSLNRTVAVKILDAKLASDPEFVARFEKEGAALATLRHPNVVSIVDRGRSTSAENTETWYLVMEFVEGPSLREVMRSPLFNPGQALKLFDQIGRAVDYAHGRGVIHRDLKPENILFDEQAGGVAKVTDFGLAGFSEKSDFKLNVTRTNVAMGTAAYMAPEQKLDARTADHRADIYSLGVILYEMLTGDVPQGSFEPPSVKKPGLDVRLDDVVAKCLRPEPEGRYPSVGALLLALEPAMPSTFALATEQSSPGRRTLASVKRGLVRFARAVEISVVLAAVGIIAATTLKPAPRDDGPVGLALMTDTGLKWPFTAPGRVDAASRTLSLGDGPDSVPLVSLGRKAEVSKDTVRFAGGEETAHGRLLVDATVPGDGLSVRTRVEVPEPDASALSQLRSRLWKKSEVSRAALLLVGDSGRFVALVLSADRSSPTLEWALGPEKRGVMTAPVQLPPGPVTVELRVDPGTSELSAWVGEGRDARAIGEPLLLGAAWKELFGQTPHAAVGSAYGAATFTNLTVEGVNRPEPTPPPVVETPPPTPPPAVTAPAPVRPVAAKPAPARKPAARPVATAKPKSKK